MQNEGTQSLPGLDLRRQDQQFRSFPRGFRMIVLKPRTRRKDEYQTGIWAAISFVSPREAQKSRTIEDRGHAASIARPPNRPGAI